MHPFMIASAFVLNLWAENLLEQVRLADVLQVWGAVLLAVAGTGAAVLAAVRNLRLAGAITTLMVIWALSFGHFAEAIGTAVGEDLVVIAWAALGIGVVAVTLLFRRWLAGLTRYLNLVGLVVVAINLVPIVPYQISAAAEGPYEPEGLDSLQGMPTGIADHRPDIYYIILDRYPSQETLAGTAYEYDNSSFLQALEQHGFYVAPYSHANYTFTAQSVASSLNMDYLDVDEMAKVAPASDAWKPVYDMLAGSLAAPAFLERQGYTYVQLPSWFEPLAAGAEVDIRYRHPSFSEFANAFYRSTIVSESLARLGIVGPDRGHQDHALFQFDKLMNLDEVPGPKFVFAHVLLPHPPYAFGPHGPLPSSQVTAGRDAPREAFLGQLEYTNSRVLEVVDDLIDRSAASDPVVIIQADEGPYTREVVGDWRTATPEAYQVKFGILNAYYMPGVGDTGLYPSITPVNTFRVLFNNYFGADFPLLDDRVYAFGGTIYDNVDITDELLRAAPTEVVDTDGVVYDAQPPEAWTAGATKEYDVTLRNTGDVTWQRDGPDAVTLYVRFDNPVPNATPALEQTFRLKSDVPPGRTATVRVAAEAPDTDGEYLLRHRLVHGVTPFRSGPSSRVTVTSTPRTWDRLLAADYVVTAPETWSQGSSATYEVTVTNDGPHTWSAAGDRPVRLGIHFGDDSDIPHDGWITDERYWLPHDVAPGRSATVEVEVTAPQEPGRYVLRHRMVKENTAWFGDSSARSVVVNPPFDFVPLITGFALATLAAGIALFLARGRPGVRSWATRWVQSMKGSRRG